MDERSFQKFAGAAAVIVALSSLLYGLVFLFLLPAAQKGAPPDSLTSFAANPTPRQILSLLFAVGGVAATAAMIGIYRQVREGNQGWAFWSAALGLAYGLLTAVHGIYLLFLNPTLSALYARNDAAIQAAAVVVGYVPSPLDPSSFSKFLLSGIWLLVTGTLMLRTSSFARGLGYLALAAGVGVILLFIGTATGTLFLVLATGVPGSAVIGPLFWLGVGYTLWTKP
ncbi:MAG TPA: DUF4386 family protein [Anaerolineae bacterium]|nr:DUF4386 family protein [Anaerolineae bacterium]